MEDEILGLKKNGMLQSVMFQMRSLLLLCGKSRWLSSTGKIHLWIYENFVTKGTKLCELK